MPAATRFPLDLRFVSYISLTAFNVAEAFRIRVFFPPFKNYRPVVYKEKKIILQYNEINVRNSLTLNEHIQLL